MPTALAPTTAAVHALQRRSKLHYEPMIIPEIKRMLAADVSLSTIARALNDAGFRNTRGKPFSRALVHFVAKSAGLIVK